MSLLKRIVGLFRADLTSNQQAITVYLFGGRTNTLVVPRNLDDPAKRKLLKRLFASDATAFCIEIGRTPYLRKGTNGFYEAN